MAAMKPVVGWVAAGAPASATVRSVFRGKKPSSWCAADETWRTLDPRSLRMPSSAALRKARSEAWKEEIMRREGVPAVVAADGGTCAQVVGAVAGGVETATAECDVSAGMGRVPREKMCCGCRVKESRSARLSSTFLRRESCLMVATCVFPCPVFHGCCPGPLSTLQHPRWSPRRTPFVPVWASGVTV